MADCSLINQCPFFNDKMESMPTMLTLLKWRYCKNRYTSCARYMVFSTFGREKVPLDLFPNDQNKAQSIIDHQ